MRSAWKGPKAAGNAAGELERRSWSGRRASNPLPQPWQGCALPSELLPRPRDRCHLTGGRRPQLGGPLHMIVLMSILTPGCCGFNYRSATRLGGLGMDENPATEQGEEGLP